MMWGGGRGCCAPSAGLVQRDVGLLGPGALCVSNVWHREGLAWQVCLPKCQEVLGALGVHWDPSSCHVCSMGSPVGLGQPKEQGTGPGVLPPYCLPMAAAAPAWAVQRKLLGALVLLCLFGSSDFSTGEKKNNFKLMYMCARPHLASKSCCSMNVSKYPMDLFYKPPELVQGRAQGFLQALANPISDNREEMVGWR